MGALIGRLWSALRSLFRRKKYVTVTFSDEADEIEERLSKELERIMEEDRKKEKAETPGVNLNPVYLRGKYEQYRDARDRQLKVAQRVQNIAMHHPRLRIRKKNLKRLGREIVKLMPLHFRARQYATLVLKPRKEEENAGIDAEQAKEAGISMVDMQEVRPADHLGDNTGWQVDACEPCTD